MKQDKIRYKALEKDWNRLRDLEYQWFKLHKLVIRFIAILVIAMFVDMIL